MTPDELAILGRYLFGARWQSALARALGVTPRLVQYWAAGARPISRRRFAEIAAMVRGRQIQRVAALHQRYRAMVDVLPSETDGTWWWRTKLDRPAIKFPSRSRSGELIQVKRVETDRNKIGERIRVSSPDVGKSDRLAACYPAGGGVFHRHRGHDQRPTPPKITGTNGDNALCRSLSPSIM